MKLLAAVVLLLGCLGIWWAYAEGWTIGNEPDDPLLVQAQELIDDPDILEDTIRTGWRQLQPWQQEEACHLVRNDLATAIDALIGGMHQVQPGLDVDRAVVGRTLQSFCR